MKETERITDLVEKIYDGDSWVGETLVGILQDITAADAASKISPKWNSIWEIVNHIISWRMNVLKRVQGENPITPEDNYFKPVEDRSEKAWQNTLEALKISQQQWLAFLQKMDEGELEKIYAKNNSSYYNNIHGIIQHDAYHLGQVVMLAKRAI